MIDRLKNLFRDFYLVPSKVNPATKQSFNHGIDQVCNLLRRHLWDYKDYLTVKAQRNIAITGYPFLSFKPFYSFVISYDITLFSSWMSLYCCIHIQTHAHIYTHADTHTCTLIYIYSLHTHSQIHTHTYIHTYIHTHTHTYMHTYILYYYSNSP